jgi:trans-aconitate methyltransferase
MPDEHEEHHLPASGMLRWDPELYDARHSFVWQRGADLIVLLEPQAGERILDLGCGTGHLTAQIAARGAEALGIDSSVEMIEEARKNYPALEFSAGDARNFSLDRPVDAVFSNAALHWIRPADRVACCIFKALKPGGRFVVEFGGKGNIQRVVDAFNGSLNALNVKLEKDPNPWYFPSIGEYSSLLEQQGFDVTDAVLFDRLTPLEGGEDGIRNWVKMFAGSFLSVVPAGGREEFIQGVESILRPQLFRDRTWHMDYRRLRVRARKPPA